LLASTQEFPDALKRALLGRYVLERELGRGGMAIVYGAHDVRHDRPVAIKVLLPELAAAIGAERFLAEIHTTAKLQHPHILPLFDSGAAEGQLYYVMPLVEGESLRERLAREGPLAVDQVARLVGEVGSALDYAHRHGVIHRDIKPANILLHEGNAMLADFGIARAAADSSAERLTETGLSIGTPQYMSPEQAVGEPDLGPASDLYSLGVVTYELLTGRLPFTGASMQAVLVPLLTAAPADLAQSRPEISGAVNSAVLKALAKRPEDRYATGAAFAAALRPESSQASVPATTVTRRRHSGKVRPLAVAAVVLVALAIAGWWIVKARGVATAAGPSRVLAVLPFANLTGDTGIEVFSHGLAVEITDELHTLGLSVVGSSAALAAAGRLRAGSQVDVQAVGKALGADAVLDGEILPGAQGGRVSLQLTDVATQRVLWSARYTLRRDLFAFQDSVAQQVAGALEVTLSPIRLAALRSGRTVNPEAHELVVRAKGYAERRASSQLDQAIALFSEAIGRDSTYVDAWAGLAETYNLRAVFGDVVPPDYFRLSRFAAERALALDSTSASVHRVLGFLAIFAAHDWRNAEAEFRKSLALDSAQPATWLFRGWYYYGMRQLDSALLSMRRARDLDSLTPIYAVRYADLLADRGDRSASAAELHRVLARNPGDPFIMGSLARVYGLERQCDSAQSFLDAMLHAGLTLAPNDPVISMPMTVWAACGQPGLVRAELDSAEVLARAGRPVREVFLAEAAAGLGDRATMYRWLDRAVENGDWASFMMQRPTFDPYHSEPRFQAVLRRFGMPAS
jgi:serine/threonine-protein kinase